MNNEIEILEPLTEEQFISLSSKDKIIRLAKDVLFYLQKEIIVGERRVYGNIIGAGEAIKFIEIKNIFKNNTKTKCEACAIGALFIAEVMYTNRARIVDIESNFMKTRLEEYFTTSQVCLIETAFEMDYDFVGSNCEFPSLAFRAVTFGKQFEFDKDRMVAIMQNIITNDGIFIP